MGNEAKKTKEEIAAEKDIKNYKLPARRRLITIPVEEGGRYEFDFCRPNLGQREAFMIKWGLTAGSTPKFRESGEMLLKFTRDQIVLSVQGGRLFDKEGKIVETYNFAVPENKDIERLDNTVVEFLQVEAQDGIVMTARDDWFRYTGRAPIQKPPLDVRVPPVPSPGSPPEPDSQ